MQRSSVQLFLASSLMLFVELGLIRLTASDVVYLSYFTNFVLLGSFLGIGIGFLRAGSTRDLSRYAPVGLAAIVSLVVFAPATFKESSTEALYYQSPGATGLPIWLMLPIVFLLSATVMAMIGEGVARRFAPLEPLKAYRIDILGSLSGIVGFTILSFLGLPPVAWGIVAAALFLAIEAPARVRAGPAVALIQVVAIVAMVGGTLWESTRPDTTWSPYHKIQLAAFGGGIIQVRINGTPSQFIQSVDQMHQNSPFFFRPYELRTSGEPPKDVLVIGAGTGSDTAAALSEGAGHVDAVEIDPGLADLGRTLNPDDPFGSGNVDLFVTDGRAFLQDTDQRYDVIIFALPDSVALVSGQSSLRLESFLFTREAIQQAKDHLAPGGIFTVSNFFRERWVIDRMAGELESVFGSTPCLNVEGEEGRLAQLTVSSDPAALNCTGGLWSASGPVPAAATDDHPFSFIRGRTIPTFYLLAIALILGVSLLGVRTTAGPFRRLFPYADLFFMGAGFLLLETRSVVVFSLLFGTTWLVNALVFGGILLAVLAAIEVARRFRPRGGPLLWYAALLGSLAVAWLVPPSWLLGLPYAARLVCAVAIGFAPVFAANVVFADRFRDVASSTTAFGANLLGAMIGGLLEYGAIIVGYRTLLLVAAALYGLAFVMSRSRMLQAAAESERVDLARIAASASGKKKTKATVGAKGGPRSPVRSSSRSSGRRRRGR